MLKKEAVRIIHKTRRDYNRIAEYFADTRRRPWAELEQFKKYIKDGQNILDWGCGNGRLIFLLKSKKINYFGADQSEKLLKIASQNFAKEIKQGWVKFYSTAKQKKKFKENFFDLVFMIASFHHLPDSQSREELLRDVYRQLKPKGKLIITVWNLESNWAKNKINNEWEQIGDNDWLVPWKNPAGKVLAKRYYHHFSKEELNGLLKKAGFKIKKIGYSGATNWSDKKGGRNLIVVAEK